jgi:hypothetical protein
MSKPFLSRENANRCFPVGANVARFVPVRGFGRAYFKATGRGRGRNVDVKRSSKHLHRMTRGNDWLRKCRLPLTVARSRSTSADSEIHFTLIDVIITALIFVMPISPPVLMWLVLHAVS